MNIAAPLLITSHTFHVRDGHGASLPQHSHGDQPRTLDMRFSYIDLNKQAVTRYLGGTEVQPSIISQDRNGSFHVRDAAFESSWITTPPKRLPSDILRANYPRPIRCLNHYVRAASYAWERQFTWCS
jgi:hypothetical protein